MWSCPPPRVGGQPGQQSEHKGGTGRQPVEETNFQLQFQKQDFSQPPPTHFNSGNGLLPTPFRRSASIANHSPRPVVPNSIDIAPPWPAPHRFFPSAIITASAAGPAPYNYFPSNVNFRPVPNCNHFVPNGVNTASLEPTHINQHSQPVHAGATYTQAYQYNNIPPSQLNLATLMNLPPPPSRRITPRMPNARSRKLPKAQVSSSCINQTTSRAPNSASSKLTTSASSPALLPCMPETPSSIPSSIQEVGEPPQQASEPILKILKRPEQTNGDNSGPEKHKRAPQKTLKQREEEYAQARLRILGSTGIDNEDGDDLVNSEEQDSLQNTPTLPCPANPL